MGRPEVAGSQDGIMKGRKSRGWYRYARQAIGVKRLYEAVSLLSAWS
jgi:hypothetical protein